MARKIFSILKLISPYIVILALMIIQLFSGEHSVFVFSTTSKAILILLSAVMVFQLIKEGEIKYKWLYLIPIFLIYVFVNPPYSPIDEAAHYDYVEYIKTNMELPVMGELFNSSLLYEVGKINIPSHFNHEFFQPPGYYILGAFLAMFSPSVTFDFYMLRVLGFLMLLMVVRTSKKNYEQLMDNRLCTRNDNLYYALSYGVLFTSGILLRMTTVSNEHLAVLLCSISYFYMVKYLLGDSKKSTVVIISIVASFAILAKVTTFIYIVVFALICLLKKEYKSFFISSGICLLIVGPWVGFNMVNYHSITATAMHLEMVTPIVNPSNINLGSNYLIESIPTLMNTFWLPQETPYDLMIGMIINVATVGIIISCYYAVKRLFVERLKPMTNGNQVTVVSILLIILNIALLSLGTLTTDVGVMIGRYMYVNVLPIIYIVYTNVSRKIFFDFRQGLIIFICLVIAITNVSSITNIFSKVNLEAIRHSYLNQADGPQGLNTDQIEFIEVKKSTDDTYSYLALQNDPQVYRILRAPIDVTRHVLRLTYITDKEGPIQIYYDDGNGFSEKNSEWIFMSKGSNDRILKIPASMYQLTDIRIDPIENSSFTFRVKSFDK